MKKVAIIGVGSVGSSICYALMLRNIAEEIVLIDLDFTKAHGEVLDIRHGFAQLCDVDLYDGQYEDCKGCELIVITAGRNRKSNETRLDLANGNYAILQDVMENIAPYVGNSILMIVSNPVDLLTYQAQRFFGFPRGRIFGTGCTLDSSRFRRQLADYMGVSLAAVDGYVVGEHGDGQFPLWSAVRVEGQTCEEYCGKRKLRWNAEVEEDVGLRTRTMGSTIIQAKGKTNYGIASCVALLSDALLNDKQIIASVSMPLVGEYGLEGAALSLPSRVGRGGVLERLVPRWTAEEENNFIKSANHLRELVQKLEG